MTWTNPNTQIHNSFTSLLMRNGDSTFVNPHSLAILEDIHKELNTEDCTLRTFRRAVGFSKNIQNDLIPLLILAKDQKTLTNGSRIVDCTIKLLVDLTIPIENLLPVDTIQSSDVGKHSLFELNKLLSNSKEAFSDSKSTKAVMDHIKQLVEGDPNLTLEQCESINNSLLLLRNLLHIPEMSTSAHSTLQNQIIWNLFTQSIDKIIIFLISSPQKLFWSVTLVQLIALLYKDQHVNNLQKLLNLWLEASLSESSEDNESNTSAPCQGSGGSSPFITSDPTSDSSDNGGSNEVNKGNENFVKETKNAQTRTRTLSEIKRVQSTETERSSSSGVSSMTNHSASLKSQTSIEQNDSAHLSKKRECPSSTSEISDCGYGTQVENQELVSTSSNDDDQPTQKPIHQKPHTFQKLRFNTNKKTNTTLDKKELRRRKLVKRSKTNTINMKGLMHHLPTDEDVSNVLKEFTVDFLLKGYGTLVEDLHTQLISDTYIHMDTSHFFWLVTYFLKFATQLELDLDHLSSVLSYRMLSYLIFQGVLVIEELELKILMHSVILKPCLRKLHLIVTAIREFLQALETYQKMVHLTEEDKNKLSKLLSQTIQTEELGNLFLLLLRQYNINFQSRQYLQDLILTNHNYLLLMDKLPTKKDSVSKFNMQEHLKRFASVDILCKYGILLETFEENGEFVNNCIFTMMHHIGGDLENISILFQPNILKSFSKIWENDFQLSDDWADLIEYVIHQFINSPNNHCLDGYDNGAESVGEIEEDSLEKQSSQNDTNLDVTSNVKSGNKPCGTKQKTQTSIIKELLRQNIIDEDQYNEFFERNQPKNIMNVQLKKESIREWSNNISEKSMNDLKYSLLEENKGEFLEWLQDILLEFCYAKIVLENPEIFVKDIKPIIEPTVYHHTLLNLPIPLIPWTSDQSSALKSPLFIVLLRKMGLYLPIDTGKIFVRIPNFWTADLIYDYAEQLGPINKNELKFDVDLIRTSKPIQEFSTPKCVEINSKPTRLFSSISKETPSLFRYIPLPNSTSDWIPVSSQIDNKCIGFTNCTRRQLSIAIPEVVVAYNLPAPELVMVPTKESVMLPDIEGATIINEDEHNSTCDTASDLTRMLVSDEDEQTNCSID